MKVTQELFDVGVIVGRFQVPELHPAHIELIEHVCQAHGKVVIVLGLSPLRATRRNPLDYQARRQMIHETFPDVEVPYIEDMASDEAWSKKLDEVISTQITPSQTVMLYGGRDSFVDHYHGIHATTVLESERYFSGETVRKEVSRSATRGNPDFRAGAVWQAFNQFPTAYPTVDVGVFNEDESKILLARKEHEKQWRLIGGFVHPKDPHFEAAARREADEEAHIAITDPQYVMSSHIEDWRYRDEEDSITTVLFKAKLLHGSPRPDDDIAEVGWFDVMTISDNEIVPNHRHLIEALVPKHSQR